MELKIRSPHDEKQPWTTWAPSVGADDASSTPDEVADEDSDVVASAAYAGKAAAIAAARNVIVFIFAYI